MNDSRQNKLTDEFKNLGVIVAILIMDNMAVKKSITNEDLGENHLINSEIRKILATLGCKLEFTNIPDKIVNTLISLTNYDEIICQYRGNCESARENIENYITDNSIVGSSSSFIYDKDYFMSIQVDEKGNLVVKNEEYKKSNKLVENETLCSYFTQGDDGSIIEKQSGIKSGYATDKNTGKYQTTFDINRIEYLTDGTKKEDLCCTRMNGTLNRDIMRELNAELNGIAGNIDTNNALERYVKDNIVDALEP